MEIRKILTERGMTMRQLAKEIGAPETKLSKVCSGRQRLSIEDAVKIAEVLGVKIEDLIKQ